MSNSNLVVSQDSETQHVIYGYENAFEWMEAKGNPVLVVQDKSFVNVLQEQGMSGICAEGGVWTNEHCKSVENWPDLVLCFPSKDFRRSFGQAISGYVPCITILSEYRSFPEFLTECGNFELLMKESCSAPEYLYQDDTEEVKATLVSAPTTIADLMAVDYPPIKWIIRDILPEGLTLVAGPSKLGKSWLSLDVALGVSFGGKVFGEIPVVQGDVLYWALEDSARRIKSRVDVLYPHGLDWSASRLSFETTQTLPPTLDAGGLDQLKSWCESVDNPRLIIIDVLEKVRPEQKHGETEYKAVYRGLSDIHKFATKRSISVLVIHHTVKGSRDGDPFDKVSGSRALTALPDATLILDRDSTGFADAIVYGRGRDLMEFEHALNFQDGRWSIMGDVETLQRSQERNAILDALKDCAKDGLSPKDIEELTDIKPNNLKQLLFKMTKAGEVKKMGRGRYVLPSQKSY